MMGKGKVELLITVTVVSLGSEKWFRIVSFLMLGSKGVLSLGRKVISARDLTDVS